MTKRRVKVAIIENSIDCSIYNPVEHWSPYLDAEWDSFKATKSQFPDFQKGYTHLILTGSEASILEGQNWAYEEVEIVQEAVERGLSVLGSCYGHQLLALAFLGNSHVRRCPQPEVGWIPIQIKEENKLLGKKRRAFSFSIHFDEVVDLSEAFLNLASSKDCRIQAFQLRERPIWGIQIHPEIDALNAHKLLKKLISFDLKAKPLFETALKSKPKDSKLIWQIAKSFLASREPE